MNQVARFSHPYTNNFSHCLQDDIIVRPLYTLCEWGLNQPPDIGENMLSMFKYNKLNGVQLNTHLYRCIGTPKKKENKQKQDYYNTCILVSRLRWAK